MSDLRDRWENAIELYMLERNWAKVARKLKTSSQVISRWRQSPEFQEMLQNRHDQLMTEVRCSTSNIYQEVVNRLYELIYCDDYKTCMSAMQLLIAHLEKNRMFDLEVKASKTLESLKNG